MSLTEDLPVELDVDGPSSPPRANGELVFAEPWESRVFGLTIALYRDGAFTWDEFKDQLVAAVARWEADHPDGEGYRYYTCWFEAIQRVLSDRQILSAADLDDREVELAARPVGHDHEHHHDDNGHDHEPDGSHRR
jgi:nitrile hydratase accessory protein